MRGWSCVRTIKVLKKVYNSPMDIKQSQIKINLPDKLKNSVKKRAERFGLTLTLYTKYLLIKDLEESEDLEFSEETLKNLKYAKSKRAKWLSADSIKELDDMVDGVK